MNRQRALLSFVCTLVLVLASASASAVAQEKKPNIVFILVNFFEAHGPPGEDRAEIRRVWPNLEGNYISDEIGPAKYAAQRGSVANPNYFD